jgi:hypothetical protein
MSNKLYEESSIQAIADSIRAKNGSSDTYTVAEMAAAIDDIPTGGTVYEETWSSQGLTYTLTSDGTLKITATNDVFIGHPDIIRNIIYCIKKIDATDTHIQGTAQDEGFMRFIDDAIPAKSLNIQFDFGSGFYYIRNNAFRNAPIASFTIPSTVRFIDALAFSGSKLTAITIPSNVERLGQEAFKNCAALVSVDIAQSQNNYAIGSSAFEGCTALASVSIANAATEIGSSAFKNCGALTSITLPNTLEEIAPYAFQNCEALTSIDIPSVTYIGNYAFQNCEALTSIDFSSLEEAEYEAFYGCNNLIETVDTPGVLTIPDTLTTTHRDTFCLRNGQTAHLTNVVIGAGLTTTTEWMFGRQTALQSVTFKGVMTSIDSLTFTQCTQQGLTINFPNMTEAQVQALSGYSSKWGATNAVIICSDT